MSASSILLARRGELMTSDPVILLGVILAAIIFVAVYALWLRRWEKRDRARRTAALRYVTETMYGKPPIAGGNEIRTQRRIVPTYEKSRAVFHAEGEPIERQQFGQRVVDAAAVPRWPAYVCREKCQNGGACRDECAIAHRHGGIDR